MRFSTVASWKRTEAASSEHRFARIYLAMADEITKHDVAYLTDIDDSAKMPSETSYTEGHILVVGEKDSKRTLVDSGKTVSDIVSSDDIATKVNDATTGLWNAINGEYALKAYSAPDWVAKTEYSEGDFCQYNGIGYRCKTAHTSYVGFDSTKWDVVLTADGRIAISSILDSISEGSSIDLSAIAPEYDATKTYKVGQLAVKDGVLQICTKASRTFSADNATVEQSVQGRIDEVSDLILEKRPDWNATDEDDVSFIRNKPTITYSGGILSISQNASQSIEDAKTDFYSKSETDTLLSKKADKSDMDVMSSALASKADSADVKALEYTITSVQTGNNDNASGISELGKQVAVLDGSYTSLNEKVTGQASDIETLSETIKAQTSDASGLASDIAELGKRVTSVEASSAADSKGLKDRVATLESEVTEIKSLLEDFNSELEALV